MNKHLNLKNLFFSSVATLFLLPNLFAQNTFLDLTFGTAGIVTNVLDGSGGYGRKLLLQNDGKMILAGYTSQGSNRYFAALRLNSDGSVDNNFGTNGYTIETFGNVDARAYGAILLDDGSFILIGYVNVSGSTTGRDVALAKFNADGTLNTAFGTNGTVITPATSNDDFSYTGIVQPDGKIVVTGRTQVNFLDNTFVIRYNADGTLDNTFGTNGVVTYDAGGTEDLYYIDRQSDGKIIIAGSDAVSNATFLLSRLNTDGTLDNSFGTSGYTATDISTSYDMINDIWVDSSDNSIYVCGEANNGNMAVLAKYTADGVLDSMIGYAFTKDANGNFLLAGRSGLHYAVIRITAAGVLDNGFGNSGIINTTIGSSNSVPYSLAVQPDGKIIAGGVSGLNNNNVFTVVRYEPNLTTEITELVFSDLSIYPNPAKETLTISNLPNGSVVNITDVRGKSVYKSVITSEQAIINTANFANGVYIVQIENSGSVVNRKLVVNK